MPTNPNEERPTSSTIASYVASNAARARNAQQMKHDSVVTRETDYKGHHIVVRTRYEVEVDGKMLMGHMGVNNSGAVHYHPVPNLKFASALDMVKKIIDVFPDEFGPGAMPDHSMPGMGPGSPPMSGEMAGMHSPAKPPKGGTD
jgi:hypothetical protein